MNGVCKKCGAEEIPAFNPRTIYACGSSDYDQRPNTFRQSQSCSFRAEIVLPVSDSKETKEGEEK